MKRIVRIFFPFVMIGILTACGNARTLSKSAVESEISASDITQSLEAGGDGISEERDSAEKLRKALGTGDVTVTLSIE